MMRRQPLRRLAPLRRRTPLRQRKATPINRRGPSTKRWEKHREQTKEILRNRSGDACEVEGCRRRECEGAHIFGRTHLIAEPFASHPLLMRWLCREHHDDIDQGRDLKLRERLRHEASRAFMAAYAPHWRPLSGSDSLQTVRQLVAALVADGWGYDAEANEISRDWAA